MRPGLLCAVLLVMAGPVAAQEQGEPSSHQRAAEELVDVMRLEDSLDRGADAMKAMAAQNPMAGPIAEVIEEFYKEFLTWDAIRPIYVQIYMDAFTEAEIRGLIDFYHTPLGQRLIEQGPEVAQQSAAATQAILLPHMPELQQRMMGKMRGGQ